MKTSKILHEELNKRKQKSTYLSKILLKENKLNCSETRLYSICLDKIRPFCAFLPINATFSSKFSNQRRIWGCGVYFTVFFPNVAFIRGRRLKEEIRYVPIPSLQAIFSGIFSGLLAFSFSPFASFISSSCESDLRLPKSFDAYQKCTNSFRQVRLDLWERRIPLLWIFSKLGHKQCY